MPAEIPATALQLRSLVKSDQTVELFLDTVQVPEPGPGEVLVRVEAAPINPSDIGLLLAGADVTAAVAGGSADRPVVTAPLSDAAMNAAAGRVGIPMPTGNEGAGTVVAAGASAAAMALLGKTVAVAGGAMYAQYRCVDASLVPGVARRHPGGRWGVLLRQPHDGAWHGGDHAAGESRRPGAYGCRFQPGPDAQPAVPPGADPAGEHRAQARARGAAEIRGRYLRVQLGVPGFHR